MSDSSIPQTTIDSYLYGCSGNYPVSEDTIAYILAKVNLPSGLNLALVSVRDRDMAEIEMLKLILRDAGMTSATSDSNGTWSHKTGAVEMNSKDKAAITRQLNALLKKYGMLESSIKIHKMGMKVWRD